MMFTTYDPLRRGIVLKKDTWTYKLLTDRPEVEPYLFDYKKLFENPYHVVKDLYEIEPGIKSIHPTREEYFDICPSRTKPGIVLLRAIVDHKTNPGEVVTAWISSKLRGLTTEGGIVYVRSGKNKD